MLIKKLLLSLLILSSSFTAFADHHTKDAQEITKKEQKAAYKKAIVKGPQGVIPFDFEFNEYSIEFLLEEINDAVKEGDKKIVIKWNSGGGSIFAGFRLIHRMLELQGQGIKFVGIVDRFCASMCFQSLQFMDERIGYPFAMLLDHPASGGDASSLKEISALLYDNVIMKLKAKGLSPITIHLYELAITKDFLFNMRTALALGLIDKVILPGSERKIVVKAPKKKEVKKPVKK